MGGGGGGGRSFDDIQSLIDRAKQELKASEARQRRNVFLSFAYEDIAAVNLLRAHAKNENSPLEFNDWSISTEINSDRAPYIKQKITERITQSSVTVVFLSEATPKSQWVSWEIEESIRLGKRVIGVYPSGSKPPAMPKEILKHKIQCVQWKDLARTIGD